MLALEPRRRLLDRVTASAAAARVMYTRRHADAPHASITGGGLLSELYRAAPGALRPGEPRRVRLLRLPPGAPWQHEAGDATHAEWLLIEGSAWVGGLALEALDFLRASMPACSVRAGPSGALLLLREADGHVAGRHLQRAAQASWAEFAPRIQRRVLHQHGGQAAMLYRTEPDATVPRHAHGHDEECLMLRGDLFLDDVLLRPLDYQLAPAGSGHGLVSTDTGVLLYAHGDLDLDLRPA
jgi:quercetin dioxygenase-like cupin family protein